MTKEQENFKAELIKLCEKHKMVAVPTYEGDISAHDPMNIVRLNDFWLDYLRNRVY